MVEPASDRDPPLALVTGCSQVPPIRFRMRSIVVLRRSVPFGTTLFREYRSSFGASEAGRESSRVPQVSSLMLEAVICILRFRRLETEITAMWPGLPAQGQRSKSLCAALSFVCYFCASADGLCVPGSNRDAARLMHCQTRGIRAAFGAATADRAAPGRRTQ